MLTALLWSFASAPALAADVVLYVVRHAEKAAAPKEDPPLTADGQVRAEALARTLADVPLTGVHSTATTRTRATAAPTAEAKGLEVRTYDDPAALVTALRAEGGQHLVVGHSNTIDVLVRAAGGDGGPPLTDTEYDRLYVVVVPSAGAPTTARLRFGR